MLPELRLITDESAPVADFADAMSTLASGVVVVTCQVDGRPWGMTVTAFASVSADPPTVLVSLASDGIAARAIGAMRRFGVSILAEEQLVVALYGSASGTPKFLEPFVDADEAASPAVTGALAHLDCDVFDELRVADHTVFFGRVRTATVGAGAPLLYHRRGYRTLAASSAIDRERSTTCLTS